MAALFLRCCTLEVSSIKAAAAPSESYSSSPQIRSGRPRPPGNDGKARVLPGARKVNHSMRQHLRSRTISSSSDGSEEIQTQECAPERGVKVSSKDHTLSASPPVKDTTYYHALHVAPDATTVEIRRAFKEFSLTQHPDKGGDVEAFKFIVEAYRVLSDPDERRKYDRFGRRAVQVPEMLEGDDPMRASRNARTEEQLNDFRQHRQSHYNEVEAVRRFKERQRLGMEDSDDEEE